MYLRRSPQRFRGPHLTNEYFPVWKGAVGIGNNGPVQNSFHTLVLSNEKGETGVQLTAAHDDTQFVVVRHPNPFACLFHSDESGLDRGRTSGSDCFPVWTIRNDQ